MLTLAASRLSMIALEGRRRGGERGWKQRGQAWKERKEKLNTYKPPAVYQLQRETEPFIVVLFRKPAGKYFHAVNSEKMINFTFCFSLILKFITSSAVPSPPASLSEGGDLHIWQPHFGFFLLDTQLIELIYMQLACKQRRQECKHGHPLSVGLT